MSLGLQSFTPARALLPSGEVVTGEMRDFSTLVPRLLEQLQRERDGQPLTSRRLVVFVFNGHNHYDATVPQ